MNPPCDRIKVLHVITRFDKGGSAENTFLTVCGLDKGRYEVVLVKGPSPSGDADDPEVRAAQANLAACEARIRVISLRHLVRNLSPLSDLIAFCGLIRVIRQEQPQIVHTHTSKAGILGRWAAWFCRVPVIVHTPHGHIFWGYFGPLQTRLFIIIEKWTARVTDAIITLTPQEREDHLRFHIAPEEKFTVIHSGVDLDRYVDSVVDVPKMKKALNLPEGSFVIGTLGRLTPIKGHIHLLKAAVDVSTHHPNVFFIFVGAGELHDNLQKYCVDAGIADHVRFLGWRSDVAAVLSVFDIFVFPSLNEGMGKALVEAMAMGKPIIASDVGGIRDLVSHEYNGLLVPPADGSALAKAIAVLYASPEKSREMGRRGREWAGGYGASAMLEKIDILYQKAIKNRR